jgi:hypothetical protein
MDILVIDSSAQSGQVTENSRLGSGMSFLVKVAKDAKTIRAAFGTYVTEMKYRSAVERNFFW